MTGLRVLQSRRVVLPDGVRPAAIVIGDGTIRSIGEPNAHCVDAPVEDFGDLAISPGCVDAHVHVNEPGRTEWEGFETATHAAAAGGTTTIADMPLNSLPVTTTRAALDGKVAATRGKLRADVVLYGGLVPGNGSELPALLDGGVAGIKAFLVHSGIDEFPASGERELREAAKLLAATGVPLLAHAELDPEVSPQLSAGAWSAADWLRSRPEDMEVRAIRLLAAIAESTGAHIHIVHVASRDAADAVRHAKRSGIPLTAETCPHYLAFEADGIPPNDPLYKCAPPIRQRIHRDALWVALGDGTLDLVATDHSPAPPSMKSLDTGDFRTAWGGIASLQFLLAATWTGARERGIGLDRLAQWLSTTPARLIGLGARKGRIAPGCDADLVVWNPEESFVVEENAVHHRHKASPWIGRRLAGRVESTILRGETVWANGWLVGGASGLFIARGENA